MIHGACHTGVCFHSQGTPLGFGMVVVGPPPGVHMDFQRRALVSFL